jgi:hypothetical protein
LRWQQPLGRQGGTAAWPVRGLAQGRVRLGERTTQNFMSVWRSCSSHKPKIIADLTIQPIAVHLLTGQSVQDEARGRAIEWAEAGERITAAVANEILADTRKKKRLGAEGTGPGEAARAAGGLECYPERWIKKTMDGARSATVGLCGLARRQEGEERVGRAPFQPNDFPRNACPAPGACWILTRIGWRGGAP